MFSQATKVVFRYRTTGFYSSIETTLGRVADYGASEEIAARMDGDMLEQGVIWFLTIGTMTIEGGRVSTGEPYDELDAAVMMVQGLADALVESMGPSSRADFQGFAGDGIA